MVLIAFILFVWFIIRAGVDVVW